MINTHALVLSSIRYGDTSLIVKCFTRQLGIRSYLLKGILSSKKGKLKAAYFQHLTLLEIAVSDKSNTSLGFIRDASVVEAFHSIQTDFSKGAIATFLAEVLSMSIQEEETNVSLFQFLETSLRWLNAHDQVADFHLVFLLKLTRYLGFSPDDQHLHLPFFDLQEAVFVEHRPYHGFLAGEELKGFKELLGTDFDAISSLKLTNDKRKALLNTLIHYFQLHLHGFKKPRSLVILNEVFKQ